MKVARIVLIFSSLIVVACSTTRKTALKKETLTQISELKTDSGSHHATNTTNTSQQTASWEEIVIEWERQEPSANTQGTVTTPAGETAGTGAGEPKTAPEGELQGNASQNPTGTQPNSAEAEISKLRKMLDAIKNSGATRATLKKGHSEASASQTRQEQSQVEKHSTQGQSQIRQAEQQTRESKSKPGWWHALYYLMFVVIATGFIYLVRTVVKRI